MRKKGFTLVELLVVIAIIALLMGILMPALARVRQMAHRMVCGTNLSGIGKAMIIYANENDEEYPRAAHKGAIWSTDGMIQKWDDLTGKQAYGRIGVNNEGTITASLYLLIHYADVTPKQFVCKGDSGTSIFKISDGLPQAEVGFEIQDVWDYGQDNYPGLYCSYSYHLPYEFPDPRGSGANTNYAVSSVSNPGTPLCADRNPYLDKNAEGYIDGQIDDEDAPIWETTPAPGYYYDKDKTGNAAAHQREGQNVLFNDSHVLFAKYPNVGLDNDHIYKSWPSTNPTVPQKQLNGVPPSPAGSSPLPGEGNPMDETDAYLVNEVNKQI